MLKSSSVNASQHKLFGLDISATYCINKVWQTDGDKSREIKVKHEYRRVGNTIILLMPIPLLRGVCSCWMCQDSSKQRVWV